MAEEFAGLSLPGQALIFGLFERGLVDVSAGLAHDI